MSVRHPAVAGMFYKRRKAELEKQIKELLFGIVQKQDENTIGIVAPHAGYEYSGRIAAHAYSCLPKNSVKNFIIIGPNHAGVGPPVSVWRSGYWLTPLGKAKVNEKMADEICTESEAFRHAENLKDFRAISNSAAKADESAHIREHSIEVQLPFIQFLFGNGFSFVPACMNDQSFESAKNLADAVARIKDAIIIASSDFTHFESGESAERKDAAAIKTIESLDAKGFYETVGKENISICGFGPIAVLMIIAKQLGGKIALIKHATSGDITGDYGSVVGYAALKAVKKIKNME